MVENIHYKNQQKSMKGIFIWLYKKKKYSWVLQFTLKLSVKTNPFFYTQKTNVHLHNQL